MGVKKPSKVLEISLLTKSEIIRYISYEVDTEVVRVNFKKGNSWWSYHKLPYEKLMEWITSESIGSWFIRNIRDNPEIKATKSN